MKKDWRYYNHAIVSNLAPHEFVDTTEINNGKVWKYFGKNSFFITYTSKFDCNQITNYWYTILDKPFVLEEQKKKHRYQINLGIKNFDVKIISFEDYHESMQSILEKIQLDDYHHKKSDKISIPIGKYSIFGAFEKNSNNLCGYAIITEFCNYISFTTLKTLSKYHKKSINAAIIYKITQHYNNEIKNGIYISNGTRTVNHPTYFNDYLIRMFGFRKAYCELQIVYKKHIKIVIDILYPLRKIINRMDKNNQFFHQVSGVLLMEEIRRHSGDKYNEK